MRKIPFFLILALAACAAPPPMTASDAGKQPATGIVSVVARTSAPATPAADNPRARLLAAIRNPDVVSDNSAMVRVNGGMAKVYDFAVAYNVSADGTVGRALFAHGTPAGFSATTHPPGVTDIKNPKLSSPTNGTFTGTVFGNKITISPDGKLSWTYGGMELTSSDPVVMTKRAPRSATR